MIPMQDYISRLNELTAIKEQEKEQINSPDGDWHSIEVTAVPLSAIQTLKERYNNSENL